jgi:hypothetical protein
MTAVISLLSMSLFLDQLKVFIFLLMIKIENMIYLYAICSQNLLQLSTKMNYTEQRVSKKTESSLMLSFH